jgi:hypothetical protein
LILKLTAGPSSSFVSRSSSHSYLFSNITNHLCSIISGGITTFGPLIISAFGYDKFTTILFNTPFGAVQFVAILGSGIIATKIKKKGPVIIGLCIPAIVGCVMLLRVDRSKTGILLFGFYMVRDILASASYNISPILTFEPNSSPFTPLLRPWYSPGPRKIRLVTPRESVPQQLCSWGYAQEMYAIYFTVRPCEFPANDEFHRSLAHNSINPPMRQNT